MHEALNAIVGRPQPLADSVTQLYLPLLTLPFQEFLPTLDQKTEALRVAMRLVSDELTASRKLADQDMGAVLRCVYCDPRTSTIADRLGEACPHSSERNRKRRRRDAEDHLITRLLDPELAMQVDEAMDRMIIPAHRRGFARFAHSLAVVAHELSVEFDPNDLRRALYTCRIRVKALRPGIRVYGHRQRWTGQSHSVQSPAVTVHSRDHSFLGVRREIASSSSESFDFLFFYLGGALKRGEETTIEWSQELYDDAGTFNHTLGVTVRYPETARVVLSARIPPNHGRPAVEATEYDDTRTNTVRGSPRDVRANKAGCFVWSWDTLRFGNYYRLRWDRLYSYESEEYNRNERIPMGN